MLFLFFCDHSRSTRTAQLSQCLLRLHAASHADFDKFRDVQAPAARFYPGDPPLITFEFRRQIPLRHACGFPKLAHIGRNGLVDTGVIGLGGHAQAISPTDLLKRFAHIFLESVCASRHTNFAGWAPIRRGVFHGKGLSQMPQPGLLECIERRHGLPVQELREALLQSLCPCQPLRELRQGDELLLPGQSVPGNWPDSVMHKKKARRGQVVCVLGGLWLVPLGNTSPRNASTEWLLAQGDPVASGVGYGNHAARANRGLGYSGEPRLAQYLHFPQIGIWWIQEVS